MGHSSNKFGTQLGHRPNRIVTEWQEPGHSWHAVPKQLGHNPDRGETHPEHNPDTAVTQLGRSWGAVATQLKHMSGLVPQEVAAKGLQASAVRNSPNFSSTGDVVVWSLTRKAVLFYVAEVPVVEASVLL